LKGIHSNLNTQFLFNVIACIKLVLSVNIAREVEFCVNDANIPKATGGDFK
jgi:hypothetical protein